MGRKGMIAATLQEYSDMLTIIGSSTSLRLCGLERQAEAERRCRESTGTARAAGQDCARGVSSQRLEDCMRSECSETTVEFTFPVAALEATMCRLQTSNRARVQGAGHWKFLESQRSRSCYTPSTPHGDRVTFPLI